MPGDITIGEVWRGQEELKRSSEQIRTELATLPGRIAAELDSKSVERITALRLEMIAADKALEDSFNLLLNTERGRIDDVRRIVFGACALILIAFIGALIELVIHKP